MNLRSSYYSLHKKNTFIDQMYLYTNTTEYKTSYRNVVKNMTHNKATYINLLIIILFLNVKENNSFIRDISNLRTNRYALARSPSYARIFIF